MNDQEGIDRERDHVLNRSYDPPKNLDDGVCALILWAICVVIIMLFSLVFS